MINTTKKIIAAGILGMLSWSGAGIQENFPSVVEAAYENPFKNIEYIQLQGDEEKAYIDKKTTEIFNTKFSHPNTEYVAPKGWKRACVTFNDVPVERFTAEKVENDRVVLLLHGGGYIGGLNSRCTSFSSDLPSRVRNFSKDKIIGEKNKRMIYEMMKLSYGKDVSVTEPYLSPVYADLTGLPKMLITVGSDELLLDDAVLFAQYAKNDGVDVTLSIYKGMSHDWTLFMPELPETKAMFEEIAEFVNTGMK